MKTLILAAIRCSLMFTAVTGSLVCVQSAQAYTVTVQQVRTNVVATGSGAINLTGLSFLGNGEFFDAAFSPAGGVISTGSFAFVVDVYAGFTGPTSFGSGFGFRPNTRIGDMVGINAGPGQGILWVPEDYVSGNPLSDSATYRGFLGSQGVIPGTYTWTWGTGLPNQNFTLIILPFNVPDGGSTVSLLGFAFLGLAGLRRKLSC
jgi:hypothetical protein